MRDRRLLLLASLEIVAASDRNVAAGVSILSKKWHLLKIVRLKEAMLTDVSLLL